MEGYAPVFKDREGNRFVGLVEAFGTEPLTIEGLAIAGYSESPVSAGVASMQVALALEGHALGWVVKCDGIEPIWASRNVYVTRLKGMANGPRLALVSGPVFDAAYGRPH